MIMNTEDRRTTFASMSRRSVNQMIVGGMGLFAAGPSAPVQAEAESTMNAEDHAGIEQLLYRHALSLDNRDSAAFADCFRSGVLTPARLQLAIDFHRKYEYTVHNVLNHSYRVKDRTATGTHYSLVCYVKNTAGQLTKFDTYARYENVQLVKEDGRWLYVKVQWKPIFSTAEVAVIKDVPPGFWDGVK